MYVYIQYTISILKPWIMKKRKNLFGIFKYFIIANNILYLPTSLSKQKIKTKIIIKADTT